MSLINEALKKAQKLRTAEQAGETMPPIPGAPAPIAKRGEARSSQTVVLIASGAIVLVVLSVVITFWLINRPSPTEHPVASNKPAPTNESATPVVAPVIVPAPTPPPATTSAPKEAAAPTASAPAPSSTQPTSPTVEPKNMPITPAPAETKAPAAEPTSTTAVASNSAPESSSPQSPSTPAPTPASAVHPAPATPTPAPAAAKADERIAAYVDSIRVTAIRANDNKVMMNDRVYRVNDIVERTLGIKLIKVAADSLTFADANGVTYVKYF